MHPLLDRTALDFSVPILDVASIRCKLERGLGSPANFACGCKPIEQDGIWPLSGLEKERSSRMWLLFDEMSGQRLGWRPLAAFRPHKIYIVVLISTHFER